MSTVRGNRNDLVYQHAAERDRHAWLAEGAKVSLEEYERRAEVIRRRIIEKECSRG